MPQLTYSVIEIKKLSVFIIHLMTGSFCLYTAAHLLIFCSQKRYDPKKAVLLLLSPSPTVNFGATELYFGRGFISVCFRLMGEGCIRWLTKSLEF